jgi:hypothetical protein
LAGTIADALGWPRSGRESAARREREELMSKLSQRGKGGTRQDLGER